ncbi:MULTISPECIES: YoaK family protein [Mogibacterium]|uniref:DUF1275 domain-containing protein n=1 Tax=Mogibacterium timidum TaxID=35519 RepID=A0A7Y9B1E1_9FIRM|nr:MULTISPECIES: YoaK family protein [Mogibacterium]EJU19203.1 PF06912 family protein [Mogibacterium sp. CM50]NWO23857.1 DUF1275 domain-containing protein [Mogibacterium timidum]
MKQKFETSESIRIGVVLAISGGFMDAYSYTGRGGVFANAETGNIVLLAISIGNKNLQGIFHYLVPIMSFAVGVMISQHVKIRRKNRPTKLHWRQVTIFFETVAMFIAAFLPQQYNLLANSLISLTCGIQVVTFAKIRGYAMSTTMCTGNLKIGTMNLNMYLATKEYQYIRKSLHYYGCIVFFIVGAIIGDFFTRRLYESAAFIVVALLLIANIMMFFNNEKIRRNEQLSEQRNSAN